MKNIAEMKELNTVKCAHCGSVSISMIKGGVHAVQYQCKECNKTFCKEYK